MAEKFQLTIEGLKKYQEELEHLQKVEEPHNLQVLQDARAQGDLSENADYDAARNEQARIEGRIKEIEHILKNYVIIDGNSGSSNIGKKITFYFISRNKTCEYSIVGKLEANPMNGTISDESPLGKAALTAKVGDIVTVVTAKEEYQVEIKNIE